MAANQQLSCTACGYSLRGLSRDRKCPECGQRVRRSMAAVRLREMRRRTLPFAAMAEAFASLILGLLMVFLIVESIAPKRYMRPPRGLPMHPEPYILSAVVMAIAIICLISSLHGTRGRHRATACLLGLPTLFGSAYWLYAALYWIVPWLVNR